MQHLFPHSPSRLSRLALLPAIVALVVFTTGGCVYRINIQQGNFLDPKALEQIVPGMPRSQVRFLLGTPMVGSAFDSDRWDYVYYLKRGHDREVHQRNVTVFFDGDKVSRIERPQGEDRNQVASTKPANEAEAPEEN